MSPSDRATFAQSLGLLAETLGAELSEFGMEGYWFALSDLTLDQLRLAVQMALKTCRFFPKPVELREYASGATLEDRVEVGWQMWRRAAKIVGSYRSIVISDGVLGETLVACFGGWVETCTTDLSPEMWASKRKEFERVYRALSLRADPSPRYLRGVHEMSGRGRSECGLIDGTDVCLLTTTEIAQWVARLAPAPSASAASGFTSVAAAAREYSTLRLVAK
jgi:hypothetical protein